MGLLLCLLGSSPLLRQGLRLREGAQEGMWSAQGPFISPNGAQSLSPAPHPSALRIPLSGGGGLL